MRTHPLQNIRIGSVFHPMGKSEQKIVLISIRVNGVANIYFNQVFIGEVEDNAIEDVTVKNWRHVE
jgi:hypothetical protein